MIINVGDNHKISKRAAHTCALDAEHSLLFIDNFCIVAVASGSGVHGIIDIQDDKYQLAHSLPAQQVGARVRIMSSCCLQF
jgi:hypothetical protein